MRGTGLQSLAVRVGLVVGLLVLGAAGPAGSPERAGPAGAVVAPLTMAPVSVPAASEPAAVEVVAGARPGMPKNQVAPVAPVDPVAPVAQAALDEALEPEPVPELAPLPVGSDVALGGESVAGPATAVADELPRHERIGREAVSRLVHLDVDALGWAIEFHPGRPGMLGLADGERRVVDVWIRRTHTVEDVLATLAHELAHVMDFDVWLPEHRDRWAELRGVELVWWPPCVCDDRDYGAGDIAEAMVVLEAGPAHWTGHHGMPTAEQLAFLASIT